MWWHSWSIICCGAEREEVENYCGLGPLPFAEREHCLEEAEGEEEEQSLQQQSLSGRTSGRSPVSGMLLDFEVTLTRTKGSWGFDADFWSAGRLQVVKIAERGPLADSNAAAGAAQVRPLDLVTAINGQPAAEANLKAITGSQEKCLSLSVVRPYRFHVTVHKNGEQWGVDLRYHETRSRCLGVQKVLSGAVAKHNEVDVGDGPRHRQVLAEDLIEAVNGVSGRPTQMMKEFQRCKVADIVILRLPPQLRQVGRERS